MSVHDVLVGKSRWHIDQGDCVAWLNSLPANSVDLLIGSPPYTLARTYGRDDVMRDCEEWISWMLDVSTAAVRVSKGLVLWVASGIQKDKCYEPAVEGLIYRWWQLGNQLWRPCIWRKVDESGGGTGIPGSGGAQWFRSDWEFVVAFKKEGWLPFADNCAMGHAPVYSQVGGEMSNRTVDGRRINERVFGKDDGFGGKFASIQNKDANGKKKRKVNMDITKGHETNGSLKENGSRPMPKVANPGNFLEPNYSPQEVEDILARLDYADAKGGIVNARVGGGHMGDRICSLNEAPYPEALPLFFINSFTQEGMVVADCFGGSFTTGKVAVENGRRFLGCDLRQSQVDLGNKRIETVTPLALFEGIE